MPGWLVLASTDPCILVPIHACIHRVLHCLLHLRTQLPAIVLQFALVDGREHSFLKLYTLIDMMLLITALPWSRCVPHRVNWVQLEVGRPHVGFHLEKHALASSSHVL